MTTFDIGTLVAPKEERDVLHSGCSLYDRAVVASNQPFILVSEEGDMAWSATVTPEAFHAVGTASPRVAGNVLCRLARDASFRTRVSEEDQAALRAIADSEPRP